MNLQNGFQLLGLFFIRFLSFSASDILLRWKAFVSNLELGRFFHLIYRFGCEEKGKKRERKEGEDKKRDKGRRKRRVKREKEERVKKKKKE